ncbi:3-oxoacyl-ACP synthase [Sphingomonas sp. UYP23]
MALAVLLPILGCGEEAAGLAFTDLAHGEEGVAAFALRRVAAEERVHDRVIQALAAGLPAPPDQSRARALSRRFHLELGRGDAAVRLARIAALDSAVCLLLSRLLRTGTPLSDDAVLAPILRGIARDEARHVRITRSLAVARMSEASLKTVGSAVRERLGALLVEAGDAFEALSFDPRWLLDDIGRLPDGLYRA